MEGEGLDWRGCHGFRMVIVIVCEMCEVKSGGLVGRCVYIWWDVR